MYRRYGEIQQNKTRLRSGIQKSAFSFFSPCDLDGMNVAGLPEIFEDLGFPSQVKIRLLLEPGMCVLFSKCQSKEPQLFHFTLVFVCGVS